MAISGRKEKNTGIKSTRSWGSRKHSKKRPNKTDYNQAKGRTIEEYRCVLKLSNNELKINILQIISTHFDTAVVT